MARTMCFILGLTFLTLGILGITGVVPMFNSNTNFVYIIEIILGSVNLLVSIYARQSTKYDRQQNDCWSQTKDNADRQRQENELLIEENEQMSKDIFEQQRYENEQHRNQFEHQYLIVLTPDYGLPLAKGSTEDVKGNEYR